MRTIVLTLTVRKWWIKSIKSWRYSKMSIKNLMKLISNALNFIVKTLLKVHRMKSEKKYSDAYYLFPILRKLTMLFNKRRGNKNQERQQKTNWHIVKRNSNLLLKKSPAIHSLKSNKLSYQTGWHYPSRLYPQNN
jgi:hypothetical protein